jgi:uncharacterized protein YjiS (DUF1127 family)
VVINPFSGILNMKVNDTNGNTQDIRGAAQYVPSSFLAPVMASGGTGYLTSIALAIGHALASGAGWIAERHARHQMWRELQGMSDHILKDLGIPRGQIGSVVDAAFAKKPVEDIATSKNSVALRGIPPAANDDNITRAA